MTIETRHGYWEYQELADGLYLGGYVTAVGERYLADGWSKTHGLFRFRGVMGDGAPSLAKQAQFLAIRGTGGCAMHGCEHVGGVN